VLSDPLHPSGRRDIPSGRSSVKQHTSGRRDIPFGCSSVQSIISLDYENFLSGPFSMLRSFELLQLASVRMFQLHVQTTLSVRPAMGFPSKTQIWEDHYNRPDDVDSRPDALIHKSSYTFKIQMSGRQPSRSGRASYLFGNCVHLINRPDDHSLGTDVRSLEMEIVCS
jgi:hypothetical protein